MSSEDALQDEILDSFLAQYVGVANRPSTETRRGEPLPIINSVFRLIKLIEKKESTEMELNDLIKTKITDKLDTMQNWYDMNEKSATSERLWEALYANESHVCTSDNIDILNAGIRSLINSIDRYKDYWEDEKSQCMIASMFRGFVKLQNYDDHSNHEELTQLKVLTQLLDTIQSEYHHPESSLIKRTLRKAIPQWALLEHSYPDLAMEQQSSILNTLKRILEILETHCTK